MNQQIESIRSSLSTLMKLQETSTRWSVFTEITKSLDQLEKQLDLQTQPRKMSLEEENTILKATLKLIVNNAVVPGLPASWVARTAKAALEIIE